MVSLFQQQLKRWRVNVVQEQVISVTHEDDIFKVTTKGQKLSARIVVVATGTGPHTLANFDTSGEANDRIMYEIYSILHVKDKKIAVIGAGDAAFDYALTLSKHNKVTILNRSDKIKCLHLLWERAQKVPSITYMPNTAVRLPVGNTDNFLSLRCESSGNGFDLAADYLILAIGRQPRLRFLSQGLIDQTDKLKKSGRFYLIGDVGNGDFRQTGIAVGEGIRAAMQIDRVLRGIER
jgi:thioredoxin reductase